MFALIQMRSTGHGRTITCNSSQLQLGRLRNNIAAARNLECLKFAQTGDRAAFGFLIKKLKFSGSKNRLFQNDPIPFHAKT
jgi:hypothetical protein